DVEVLDLRSLWPLDWEAVEKSVSKTHKVVVAHEACVTGGFGAEIAARIQESLFDELDAPVVRVGARRVPHPFSPPLEGFVIPGPDSVADAARRVMGRVS
ncbi:MAG: transketolase C-terminal domain-containing protein, partial [Thermodesulfobacteriota bacterium]